MTITSRENLQNFLAPLAPVYKYIVLQNTAWNCYFHATLQLCKAQQKDLSSASKEGFTDFLTQHIHKL